MTFFSETASPKLVYLVCSSVMLYIDPANDAPGVQNDPTPGDISSHILIMGKEYKNLLRNDEDGAFIFCV